MYNIVHVCMYMYASHIKESTHLRDLCSDPSIELLGGAPSSARAKRKVFGDHRMIQTDNVEDGAGQEEYHSIWWNLPPRGPCAVSWLCECVVSRSGPWRPSGLRVGVTK